MNEEPTSRQPRRSTSVQDKPNGIPLVDFWSDLEAWIHGREVVIERRKGSPHPRFPHRIYPLDYGFLDGTKSGDGLPVDVWIGSLPDRSLAGIVCTVDRLKNDVEMKILLACTQSDAEVILAFHSSGPQFAKLVMREVEPPLAEAK